MKEGNARLETIKGLPSKNLDVFYNPYMKLNRDISVLLLNSLDRKFKIGLPLAASGVRGIRFMLETDAVESMNFNDYDKKAVDMIKKNLELNSINAEVTNKDANIFLLENKGFDYIDIDPFGTPVPYLESAIVRLSRNGILAVTATDTSSLAGSHPKPCLRKYWAKPLRNHSMHETGIRILARRVQLIGASHDKALIPIFSYAKRHYYRIFFRCIKSKKQVDNVIEKIKYIRYEGGYCASDNPHNTFAGPLWTGQLWEEQLCKKMLENSTEHTNFLSTIAEESGIDSIGFYHTPTLAKNLKLGYPPALHSTIKKIRKKGYKACRTHFDPQGFRSDISYKELVEIIQ